MQQLSGHLLDLGQFKENRFVCSRAGTTSAWLLLTQEAQEYALKGGLVKIKLVVEMGLLYYYVLVHFIPEPSPGQPCCHRVFLTAQDDSCSAEGVTGFRFGGGFGFCNPQFLLTETLTVR